MIVNYISTLKELAMSNWFVAHKEGLRQIADRLVERRGFGIVGGELYQNVMDTNATECRITINKLPNRPVCELSVTDNDPTGFTDLAHAWTVFAPSLKKTDPTKAGRFNLGEKMVLAFCKEAKISTTKGTVVFNSEGRQDYPRRKRECGTEFWAIIDCTQDRYEQFMDYMNKLIVRPGLELYVNDKKITSRKYFHSFSAKVPTEIAGDDGVLRKSVRLCEIEIYEALDGEVPSLYEMGIPVVDTGDKWHYNIKQKVPLNVDRDNVTPAFLREVRTIVFNEMHTKITNEDTTATWVNEASDDGRCSSDAAETFRIKKYGNKSVAFDPTNPEANAEAVSHGYTVIPSRGLSSGQRENLYKAGTLKTSSTAFPTAGKGAYSDDPNAKPVDFIPESEWTDGMKKIYDYTNGVALRILGKEINVRFVKVSNFAHGRWLACYGRGHVLGDSEFHYNIFTLGKKWFDSGATIKVDSLILHELAHEYESNHLSKEYYDACTDLGAKLKKAALKEPEWFNQFSPVE
jgi:hypothetical protein